jgi:hypothetical protein
MTEINSKKNQYCNKQLGCRYKMKNNRTKQRNITFSAERDTSAMTHTGYFFYHNTASIEWVEMLLHSN